METVDTWINKEETQKLRLKAKDNPNEMFSLDFYRDPSRSTYYEPKYFYSPADGVVIYSKIVDPKKNIVNVKGYDYTVESLLREEIDCPCLIIGIFMTMLDVHMNRIPTDGFLSYVPLHCIKVMNLSMRPIEKEILDKLQIDYKQMKYALFNERVRNTVFVPKFKFKYYIVQIADFEVDVICHFEPSNSFFTQCQRFATVRMGSQVDLIIPLKHKRVKFESLLDNKAMYHVEAGVDKLVKIVN